MGRPPADRTRDTRRTILAAALDLFAADGFDGTSMRALAARVGVRESALYHHFPSKEAVLREVVLQRAADRMSEVEGQLDALLEKPFPQLVEIMVRHATRELRTPDQRKFARVFLVEGRRLDEVGADWPTLFEKPRRILNRVLAHYRARGEVRDDVDPELLQLHVAAPMVFATNIIGEHRFGMPTERFIRQHTAFVVRAMSPATATGKRAAKGTAVATKASAKSMVPGGPGVKRGATKIAKGDVSSAKKIAKGDASRAKKIAKTGAKRPARPVPRGKGGGR